MNNDASEWAGSRQNIERLVIEVVAEKITHSSPATAGVGNLLANPHLKERDFTALGLSSLDWMDIATRLEESLGIELPDELLLDSTRRTVAGWSSYIYSAVAVNQPSPRSNETDMP